MIVSMVSLGCAKNLVDSERMLALLKQNGYVRKFQPVRLKNGLVGLWDFVEEKVYLPKNASGGFATFSAVGSETRKMFNKGMVLILR